jgi:hypothetical protein
MTRSPWDAPALSTLSEEATRCYRHGVAAFVAESGHAAQLLDAAVVADPQFVLAHVAAGVVALVDGRLYSDPPPGPTNRGERQHVETVREWARGESVRARDLRREHLLEYPGDLLIVCLPFTLTT